MASKKTLNAKNLEELGAARLSELMIEITRGDAEGKRRLRLELAGAQGSNALAAEIRKRMVTIGRSRSFVEWDKIKKLIKDLDQQRIAIATQVAKDNPVEALDLLWRFMALANSVFERCDDGSGRLVTVFHQAVDDLGEIAEASDPEPETLADQVHTALTENDYGQCDYLIRSMTPALGALGLEYLKQSFITLSQAPLKKPRSEDREVIGYGSGGTIYADDYTERRRDSIVNLALQKIADAQGDVDAFNAQQNKTARSVPAVAADIAQRLLAAGRVEEAWSAINAVGENRSRWIPTEWEQTRIEILDALGRVEDAKQFQWACFEQSLSAFHLRAYLKRLPEFDDVEVEERAMRHALQFSNVHQSLLFLISWPGLDVAEELVLSRSTELDGDYYQVLTPAAEALEEKHLLASKIIRRELIDFALMKGRSSRYRHAARHLQECAYLAGLIDDFGSFETHEDYQSRLRSEHGRKSSFWGLVTA